ncbi:MAG: 2-hydroxyacid dehydrogenase, partial [Deltaproteobacteria bacterium]|nr:2-hydroxyacid dehydrogenase [Deltaproteobacteria bacterium]
KLMRIIVASLNFPAVAQTLARNLPDDQVIPTPEQELFDACRSAQVVVPTMARIPAEVITGSGLKLIHQWGVGLEGVDIAAATAEGIPVCNVPADQAVENAESTSEHAVFLMMAVARRINQFADTFRNGPWGVPLGTSLFGRKALIVGLGRVGQALARRLGDLHMEVSAIKAHPDPPLAEQLGLAELAGPDELHRLLGQADFVAATLTATPSTVGMFDQAAFAAMRPGAFFVNVGRGSVVDEAALLAALDSGHLGGAGLDVFASEPPGPEHPLLVNPMVVATPHIGGVTEQSFEAIGRKLAANIERLRRGEPLLFRAN